MTRDNDWLYFLPYPDFVAPGEEDFIKQLLYEMHYTSPGKLLRKTARHTWLVYADWLEENHNQVQRANFIRTRIGVALRLLAHVRDLSTGVAWFRPWGIEVDQDDDDPGDDTLYFNLRNPQYKGRQSDAYWTRVADYSLTENLHSIEQLMAEARLADSRTVADLRSV